MVSGNTDQSIRVATDDDTLAVRKLDHEAFPPDSVILQRAEPGELEAGIQDGDIFVLETAGRVVGYIYADRSRPGMVYMSGIAVHPEVQGQGLGGLLVDHVLSRLQQELTDTPFVTITSPRNTRMLRTLFRHGFVARWALRDFFGPQRHRVGCQLRTGPRPTTPANVCWVPASALGTVFWLMESQGYVLRGLVDTQRGPQFDMSMPDSGEFLEPVPQLPVPERREGFG